MILVVITMLAIATNQVEIRNLVYVLTNAIDIFFITMVIDGISLWHAYDHTVDDLVGVNQTQPGSFLFAKFNELFVAGGP